MANLRKDVHLLRHLVTFQSASRTANFTQAALELGISRVAVSRQIAELEEALGQKLFARNHRTVTLTQTGDAFAKNVNPALAAVAAALARQRADVSDPRISVTVTSAFATYWLMPRLIDFGALHPDIEINLVVSDRYIDIEAENIDVAVRYSPAAQTGAGWSPLFLETIFPVYSPRYAARTQLKSAQDLRRERLLFLSGRYRREARWEYWFSQRGLSSPEERSGVSVNTYINMLQAAIEGQGIALAGRPLVDTFLADGSLKSLATITPLQRDYYYLYQRPDHARACMFSNWVESQFREMPERPLIHHLYKK
ncbi:LysR substrate-binding domain-containing protein [Yoonia sp. SS1-5]|uniref:LysR substrate-binding domain-containing protein n=1 Tax=Yoonia rhodophyticola TaxID=3137370 RepID=A0ABZ3JC15_9RHOB